jgi:alanine racemase
MDLTRPAWLEIDLDRMQCNYDEIRKVVPETADIMAVVKADAYGHGAARVARELMSFGVKRFGVATLSEALNIRKKSPQAQVLIMGYNPDYLAQAAVENSIRTTIYLKEQAELLSKTASAIGKDAIVHIKLETGMNRLGFPPTEGSLEIISDISKMDNIIIEGIFTHFPASDDDWDYTRKSMKSFVDFVSSLESMGIKIPVKHVNNSAAIMNFPEFSQDMVRAGVLIYGVYPFPEADREFLPLKMCLSLKAQVSHVKNLKAGEKVGYGLTYTASKDIRVATLPIGYADGWSRDLSNKGQVLLGGKRASIIGRVCMDQMMVDVTGIDVSRGDEVVLMGRQGEDEITIEEIAALIGQIPAAVLCMFSRRLPRVYIKNKGISEVVDYLLE